MKRTLIAAAVLTVASGSALAHNSYPFKDPSIFDATAVSEQVGIEGWVTLFGCVQVSSASGAIVDNTQNVVASASLDALPSSYVKGDVTTSINNNYSSSKGSSAEFGTSVSSSESSSTHTQGAEESSSDASHNQSSLSSSDESEYSSQKASEGEGFSHTAYDSGSFAASSQQAGGSHSSSTGSSIADSVAIGVGPYGSHSSDDTSTNTASSSGQEQSAASSKHSSEGYDNLSDNYGSSKASEGSSQDAHRSTSTEESSGSQMANEQSSSYAGSTSHRSSSFDSTSGFNESLAVSDVSVHGSVTSYTDTQAPSTLTATTGAGAVSGASGNIGLNITEGIDNAQSNDAALASVDAGNVFGNAQIFNGQTSSGSAHINNFLLNASIGDNSLQNVSGNVGVNVASGIGNGQNNSLAASTSTVNGYGGVSDDMVATDENNQSANMSFHGSMGGEALLGANALQNSQGNIGVNIAGGAGNVQHNGLAIASISTLSR